MNEYLDFSNWLGLDGVGMEGAKEVLIQAKLARFANETKPAGWTLREWINVVADVYSECTPMEAE